MLIGLLGINIISGAGCQKQELQQDDLQYEETWKNDADDPVELSWYINYSWYDTGWGENLVSKKITEETGVSVRFVTPTGSETGKLEVMMSSNTLPDMVTLDWHEGRELAGKDMVYALNELADQYDAYFYKAANPDVLEWYTEEDGNIYCYPNSFYTPQDYENHDDIGSNQNFLVRKDLYEAIGSPDMTTPQGFEDAVKKVTEMFPTVNGKPLIPIGADEFHSQGCKSFDEYLQNFLAVPYEEDGKLYDRYTDKEFIAWLKVFRKLADEGYLADDIFIDKRAQMAEKFEQGRYFCMLYQGRDMLDQQKLRYSNDPDSIYIAVEGPRNSDGDNPRLPGAGLNGWTVTLISKNCRNPERAIAFMSYLISEHGQKRVYLGVEGKTYDMVDNQPVIIQEVKELLDTDRKEYDRIYGADDTYWMLQNNILQKQWQQEIPEAERQLKEWTYPYTIYTGAYDIAFPNGTDEANRWKRIQEEWGNVLPKLLLSSSEEEFDQRLQEFLTEREKYSYKELMETATLNMIKIKEKLGLE